RNPSRSHTTTGQDTRTTEQESAHQTHPHPPHTSLQAPLSNSPYGTAPNRPGAQHESQPRPHTTAPTFYAIHAARRSRSQREERAASPRPQSGGNAEAPNPRPTVPKSLTRTDPTRDPQHPA